MSGEGTYEPRPTSHTSNLQNKDAWKFPHLTEVTLALVMHLSQAESM